MEQERKDNRITDHCFDPKDGEEAGACGYFVEGRKCGFSEPSHVWAVAGLHPKFPDGEA